MSQNQVWKEGEIIPARAQNYPTRQFKLIKLLGEGCEGQVFQAQAINWNFNQNFALKIHFESERAEYITFIENIIGYQNQYECNEQNYIPSQIIRIYDKFEYQHPKFKKKQLMLVMELGQQELYQLIKQLNRNNLQTIQEIIFYVTKSVQFLHSNNMFHRDLKPENFMVVGQQVKLIDFGFIKYQADNARQTPNVGSIVFQAPEIIQGNTNYSQAIDIWSLACVFYEVITNKQLIQFKSRGEYQNWIRTKSQQLQKDLHDIISKLGIPETWKSIIKSMLSIDQKKRPQINEVLQVFEISNTQAQPINQEPINQQPIYQQPINQQPIYQQPINQYSNYDPNKVGYNGPYGDQRIKTDGQYNQQNQSAWNQGYQQQQPKIIEQQNKRQDLSINSKIISLPHQLQSNNDQTKNPQFSQDFNTGFKQLNLSIQSQDQSLQRLKQQQIEQQNIIDKFQSELNEVQKQEDIIKENNQKIQKLFNQLKNKQDINSQIKIQKINYQYLQEIEIQLQTQQNLQSMMYDLNKLKDLHKQLGDQIIKQKSLIQQEIQQFIEYIKKLESQIQSERNGVDNCNNNLRNLEIENNTNKLKSNFEKYKQTLFQMQNIIQSNKIIIGKLETNQTKQ